jgi:hypothetical protein
MDENLKPCPFCGSDDLYVGHACAFTFHVSCNSCRSSGRSHGLTDDELATIPDSSTDEEVDQILLKRAIESWNKREA